MTDNVTRSDNNKTKGAKGDLFDQHNVSFDQEPIKGDLFDTHGVDYQAPTPEATPVETPPVEDDGSFVEDSSRAVGQGFNSVGGMLNTAAGLAGEGINRGLARGAGALGLDGVEQSLDQSADFYATQWQDTGLSKALDYNAEWYESGKSNNYQDDRESLRAEIDSVPQGEGEQLRKGYAAFMGTVRRPRLLSDFVFNQIPMLISTGVAGRAVGVATGSAKAATAGAVGTGAAMQGLSVTEEARDAALNELELQRQMTPDELDQLVIDNPEMQALVDMKIELAEKKPYLTDEQIDKYIAHDLGKVAGAKSAIVSLLVNAVPGARKLDAALAGAGSKAKTKLSAVGSVGKAAVGESVSEAVEEGFGVAATNEARQAINPEVNLMEGVGEAAGQGALSFITGGAGEVVVQARGKGASENEAPGGTTPDLLDAPVEKGVTSNEDSIVPKSPLEGRKIGKEDPFEPNGYKGDERRVDSSRRERINSMTDEEVEGLVYRNELTGLMNRRAFNEDIENAKQVVSIDIDALASTNDYGSMDAGDQLLKNAAGAFDQVFGSNAYHISGDELYLLDPPGTEQEVRNNLKQVREIMAKQQIETTKDGKKVLIDGANFTYGIGGDKESADADMKGAKTTRTKEGKRTARKELPPNMKFFDDAGKELSATLDESGKLILAGDSGIVDSETLNQPSGETNDGNSKQVSERDDTLERVSEKPERERSGQREPTRGESGEALSEQGVNVSSGRKDLQERVLTTREKRHSRVLNGASSDSLKKLRPVLDRAQDSKSFLQEARKVLSEDELRAISEKSGIQSIFQALKWEKVNVEKPAAKDKPKDKTADEVVDAVTDVDKSKNKGSSKPTPNEAGEYGPRVLSEEGDENELGTYADKKNYRASYEKLFKISPTSTTDTFVGAIPAVERAVDKPFMQVARSIDIKNSLDNPDVNTALEMYQSAVDAAWKDAGLDPASAPPIMTASKLKRVIAKMKKDGNAPAYSSLNVATQWFDPNINAIVINDKPTRNDIFSGVEQLASDIKDGKAAWNTAQQFESVLHEVGHAVHYHKWNKTPYKIRQAVFDEYLTWRKKNSKDKTGWYVQNALPAFLKYNVSRGHNKNLMGGETPFSINPPSPSYKTYIGSFDEWMANEVARSTFKSARSDASVVGKYGRELMGLLSKAYDSMYKAAAKYMGNDWIELLDRLKFQNPSDAVDAFVRYNRDSSAISAKGIRPYNANFIHVDENGDVPLIHYSNADFKMTDPGRFGTSGIQGMEKSRYEQSDFTPGTYFGIPGYTKEQGLGQRVYYSKIKAEKLYDWHGDPEGIIEGSREFDKLSKRYRDNANLAEKRVKEAGYAGYFTDQMNYAVIFEKLPVYPGEAKGKTFVPDNPARETVVTPAGMPVRVKVRGETKVIGPNAKLQEVANGYMEENGLNPDNLPQVYKKVDEKRAARIAQAYDKMEHKPNDPEVKAAFEAMRDETYAQYQYILDNYPELTIEFNPEGKDPYGSPWNATLDVMENDHLYIFPTDEGYGSSDADTSDNPLLEVSPFKISGKPALANDIFRAVHDLFGHVKDGNGFFARGEEHAWRSHSAMYTDSARRAMTAETRGQNSWVNFGPAAAKNKGVTGGDTTYADQKTGLLPEWVTTEGAMETTTERVFAARGSMADDKIPSPKRESGGRYIGAPPRVGASKSALNTMRKKLLKLAIEGEVGKLWYENSSEAILRMTGGNKEEAEKLAALFAIYSAQATVKANTAKVMNAYHQFKTTGTIKGASMGSHDTKAIQVMEGKLHTGQMKAAAVTGIKRNSFYQNLMVHIDRSRLDPGQATMDMWMAIAAGYPDKVLDQGPKYDFMNNEVRRVAAKLNITPWQAQASIWTAIKARWDANEKKAIESELKKGIRVFKEGHSMKSPAWWRKTSVVEGREADHYLEAHDVSMRGPAVDPDVLLNASYDFADALKERNAHIFNPGANENNLSIIEGVLKSSTGNRIADALGIATPASEVGYSAFNGERGMAMNSNIPVAFKDNVLQQDLEGGDFKGRNITEASRKLINAFAAAKAYVMREPRMVWHFPVLESAKSRHNTVRLSADRVLTVDEARTIESAITAEFPGDDIAVVRTVSGYDFIRTKGDNKTNITFGDKIEKVLGDLDIDNITTSVTRFRSIIGVVSNDWKKDSKGEAYKKTISAAGRPDSQRELDDIQSDIDRELKSAGERPVGSKGSIPSPQPQGPSSLPGRVKAETKRRSKNYYERFKLGWRRQMTTEGLLNLAPTLGKEYAKGIDSPFQAKMKADGLKFVGETNISYFNQRMRNAMVKGYGTRKLTPKNYQDVNNYLAGDTTTPVPRETKKSLDEIRAYIDGLSDLVIETVEDRIIIEENKLTGKQRDEYELALATDGAQGYIPVALQRHIEMLNTIANNKGQYLHRSYAVFDDSKWKEHVMNHRPDLLENAKQFIMAEDESLSESQAQGIVESILVEATDSGDMTGLLSRGSKYGSKDRSVLRRRKEVPLPIRELLGEHKDARVNVAKTATKLTYLVANHRFLMSLYENGKDIYLLDKPNIVDGVHFTKRIANKTNENLHPLAGYYTTEEFAQGLEDAVSTEVAGEVMRYAMMTNAAVKYGKTIVSPATQLANFASGFFFTMANGHILSTTGLASVKKAGAVSSADLAGENAFGRFMGKRFDKGWSAEKYQEYINSLVAKGVLHNSPVASEMRNAIEDFMEFRTTVESGWNPKTWLEFMQKTYQLGDDFWKIIGYESEKASKLKAGYGLDAAERFAADRIVNGYPTYSMVPRLVQQIRRWWLVGTFVSFPYEMMRTTANQYRFLKEDFKADKPAFYRRAIGLSMTHAMFTALASVSMAKYGMEDEDDEAVKSMLPPWSRNSTLMYTGFDEKGFPTYVDMTRWNPYAYVQNPLRAMVNGNNETVGDKLKDSLKELSDPFIGPEITATALVEVWANKKLAMHGEVFNEQDSAWDQFKDKFNHLRRNMQPTVITQMEKVGAAVRGETRGAKQLTVSDELLALLSIRSNTLNVPNALKYKAYGFMDGKRNSTRILSRTVNRSYEIADKDLKASFTKMMNAREKVYRDMIEYVEVARKLNVSDADIRNVLRSKRVRVGVADTDAIMKGNIPEWKIPKNFVKITHELDPANRAIDNAKLKQWQANRNKLIKKWLKERREQTN